jgi:hypothetical protein
MSGFGKSQFHSGRIGGFRPFSMNPGLLDRQLTAIDPPLPVVNAVAQSIADLSTIKWEEFR